MGFLDKLYGGKTTEIVPEKQSTLGFLGDRLARGSVKYGVLPVAGMMQIGGDVAGIEPLASLGKTGGEGAQLWLADKEKANPSQKFQDINSLGSAGKWATEQLTEFAPQAAIMAITGGVGGAAGKLGTTALIDSGIASAESLAGKSALRAAVNSGRALTADEMATLAANRIGTMGAQAANSAGSIGMETATIYQGQKDGEKDAGRAAIYGVAAGLLDSAVPNYLMQKTGVTKLLPGLGGTAKEASDLIGSKAMTFGQRVKDVGAVAGEALVAESGQEGIQTILERIGSNEQVQSDEALKNGFWSTVKDKGIAAAVNPEAWNDIVESMAAGGLMGVAMGGGASAAGHALSGNPKQTSQQPSVIIADKQSPSGMPERQNTGAEGPSSSTVPGVSAMLNSSSGEDNIPSFEPPLMNQNPASTSVAPISDGPLGNALMLGGIGVNTSQSIIEGEYTEVPQNVLPAAAEPLALPAPPSEFEKAQAWAKQQIQSGQTHLMQNKGISDEAHAARILQEYRKATSTLDNKQENSSVTNILPEVQNQRPGTVDGLGLAVPEVQKEMAGVGSDNRQSGGLNSPIEALKAEKSQLLSTSKTNITGGLVFSPEVTQRLNEINAQIQAVGAGDSTKKTTKVPEVLKQNQPTGINARRQFDANNDSLIVAVAKLGGISRPEIDSHSGNGKDLAHALNGLATKEAKAGIMHVISSKGKPLDRMRESLVEHGYLAADDSINVLLDRLDSSSRGMVYKSNQAADVGENAYRDAEIRYSEMINAMTDSKYEEFSRNQWLDSQVQELADAATLIDEYLDEVIEAPMTAADWLAVENDLREALDATEISAGNSTEDSGTEQENVTSKKESVFPVSEGNTEVENTKSADSETARGIDDKTSDYAALFKAKMAQAKVDGHDINEHGVYQNVESLVVPYTKGVKRSDSLEIAKGVDGKFRFGYHLSSKTGDYEGAGSSPSFADNRKFDTRAEALQAAVDYARKKINNNGQEEEALKQFEDYVKTLLPINVASTEVGGVQTGGQSVSAGRSAAPHALVKARKKHLADLKTQLSAEADYKKRKALQARIDKMQKILQHDSVASVAIVSKGGNINETTVAEGSDRVRQAGTGSLRQAASDVLEGIRGSEYRSRPLDSDTGRNRTKQEESDALIKWAKETGHLLDYDQFSNEYASQFKETGTAFSGGEHDVVFKDEYVEKRNNLPEEYHHDYSELFNRVDRWNETPHVAQMELLGISEHNGVAYPVFAQKTVKGRDAALHEVESFLTDTLNLEPVVIRGTTVAYRKPGTSIIYTDVFGGNTKISAEGTIYPIDYVIYEGARADEWLANIEANGLDALRKRHEKWGDEKASIDDADADIDNLDFDAAFGMTKVEPAPQIKNRLKLAREKFIARQTEKRADALAKKYAQRFGTAMSLAKAKLEANKTKRAEHQARKSVAESSIFTAMVNNNEIGQIASLLAGKNDAAGRVSFADQAEKIIAKHIQSLIDSAETPQAMLAYSELLVDGHPILSKKFFESLRKDAAKVFKQNQKDKNRDTEAYRVRLELELLSNGIILDSEEANHFKEGFDHALKGKTKSTLPSDDSRYFDGYTAGQSWIRTEAGKAWFEGTPQKKEKSTGDSLRRWFDRQKKDLASIDATDMKKAWQRILKVTARADHFQIQLADDATPGAKTWMEKFRSYLNTFPDYFTLEAAESRFNKSKYSYKPEDVLTGRYENSRGRFAEAARTKSENFKLALSEDGSLPDDSALRLTDAERLDTAKKIAVEYQEKLQELAAQFKSVQKLDDIRRVLKGLYGDLSGVGSSRYALEKKMKESGEFKQSQSLYYGVMSDIAGILPEYGSHGTWEYLEKREHDDNTKTRKDSLTRPRLDKIERKGLPDTRKGKDIAAAEFKKQFGFADVTIGEWVTAQQSKDHLNYSFDAFQTLAGLLGAKPEQLSFADRLHFAIGALGSGKYAATFHPEQPHNGSKVQAINVTNTRGDGAVLHEFFHAIDFMTVDRRMKQVIESVKRLLVRQPMTPEQILFNVERFITAGWSYKNMGKRKGTTTTDFALYWLENGFSRDQSQTQYYKNALKLDGSKEKPYWANDKELFARMAEAWAYDTLKSKEQRDDYLQSDWAEDGKVTDAKYRGTPYPVGDERERLVKLFGELIDSMKWTDNGPVLKDGHRWQEVLPFEEAMAPFETARLQAIRDIDKIAADMKQAEADKKAESERLRQEAVWGAIKEEEQTVEPPSEVVASEDPAVGVSVDELEALFDEAAAELREEAQEPAADSAGQVLFEHQAEIDALSVEPEPKVMRKPLPKPGEYGSEGSKVRFAMYDKYELYDVDQPNPSDVKDFNKLLNEQYTAGWGGWAQPEVEYKDHQELANNAYNAGLADGAVVVKNKKEKADSSTKKTRQAQQDKTAAALAKEMAQYGVKGIDEALKGLVSIFGGGQGKLMSFPAGFDEESYKKAKPHFETAAKAFQQAGQSFSDFVKTFFKAIIKTFGEGVKPYAVQFAKEYEAIYNQQAAAQPSDIYPVAVSADNAPSSQLADWVHFKLSKGQATTWQELFSKADQFFNGTQATGTYTVKDAYDAMELGVNRYLLEGGLLQDGAVTGNIIKARMAMGQLEALLELVPTQTKRTAEMEEFQQFSTPPHFAFLANWTANLNGNDVYLEPSAGIGGLATFGKLAGVKEIVVNELSGRRLRLLNTLGFNQYFNENAEQLDNILPDDIKPTVIVMNPPFTSTAGRVQGERKSINGGKHIEQALARLVPGGRLVAIVGEGMAHDKPAFRDWWKKIEQNYAVRANIGIEGTSYAKYGTTFDNQLLVIDKVTPDGKQIITGKVAHPFEALDLLKEVRDERPIAETVATGSDVAGRTGSGTTVQTDTSSTTGVDASGSDRPAGVGSGGRGSAVSVGSGNGAGNTGRTAVSDSTGQSGKGGTVTDQSGRAGAGGNTGRTGTANVSTSTDSASGADLSPKLGSEIALTANDNSEQGEINNSQFEQYAPKKVRIEGAVPHNTPLVESAALASVVPPDPTYTPNLPKEIITKGLLSDAQLEAVVYAGQAHQQWLANGERRGFFLGDGTGVGKGRQISGIIIDNMRQGQKKAVWVSKKGPLIEDAKRDFSDLGGDAKLIFSQGKIKAGDEIAAESGILFTGYPTLRGQTKAAKDAVRKAGGKSRDDKGISYVRTQQIFNWLGKNFDGVIVFDEAHEMGNAVPMKGKRGMTKPSEQALAALELQKALPKAKIVYVSATGATEVSNLAYAERLGLWGEGTPFQSVTNFVGAMSQSVSAMELVAQNLKQMGLYLARSLSFDGVTYNKVEHDLTDYQRETYDLLAGAWQTVLQNMNEALELTGVTTNGGKSGGKETGKIKSAILSAFWGSHQRFFNQIITAGAMPSVIDQIEQDMAAGKSVVLQLVNTNEADQERALAKMAGKEAVDEDDSVEELDLTPREQLISFIEKAFPVVQQEQYSDGVSDSGKPVIRLRPVVDAKGNPVFNKQALAEREKLIEHIRGIRIPDSAMQMLFNHFGSDKVAEITGRTQRVIYDEKGKMKVEKRSPSAVSSDSDAFKNGKKRILIFSQAGGTGFSFHADKRYKNQEQRVHYILQPGWSADKAIQGLGRSHRTNQSSTPIYRLVTTDIPAQKRFISSIARRLEQLGALTSGQRDTAGGSLFSAADNLESKYSTYAVKQFFANAFGNRRRGDYGELPGDLLTQMGLDGIIDPETNQIADDKIPQVTQFLNRLLSLRLDTQGKVFDLFLAELEQQIEAAKQMGSFDDGLQTIQHVGATVNQEEEVYRDPMTNAPTKYVAIEYKTPNPFYDFDETNKFLQSKKRIIKEAGWFQNNHSKRITAIYLTSGNRTTKDGRIVSVYGIWNTSGNSFRTRDDLGDMQQKWTLIEDIGRARELWEAENKLRPATSSNKLNLVVGGILPIWDRFNNEHVKVARIGTDDGRRFLGREIPSRDLRETMKKLNVSSPIAKMTGAELAGRIMTGDSVEMSNGWKMKRVKLSNDTRIEVLPKGGFASRSVEDQMTKAGVISERVQYTQRYFVPTGVKAGNVIDSLMFSFGMNAVEVGSDVQSNDSQFSIASNAVSGLKATELQKEFADNPLSSRIKVVQSSDQLPGIGTQSVGLNIEGQYLGGIIYLVADNLPTVERARIVALGHELTHAGQSAIITDMAVAWFRDAQSKGKAGSPFQLAAMQILNVEAAKRGYLLGREADFRAAVQEATAVIGEAAYRTGEKNGLFTRLLMYLKHFLRNKLGIKMIAFADQEIVSTVVEMMRQGKKSLINKNSLNGGQQSIASQGDAQEKQLADHLESMRLSAKTAGMVRSLIELAGQSIPPRLKANIGRVFSNPWFGSEGKPIRRHVVNLNLERSQNRNGIISDLFQTSEGYAGVEGLDNILKNASKEELKQFNELIKYGDENGVAKTFTSDELYRGKTKFGEVSKTVVEAYKAFQDVMQAANRVRFEQLDELALLPYKDQEWFSDLVELLNKNQQRISGLSGKEAGEFHRLIRSLKRGLTDEQLTSGENPTKIKASPAVIAAYRDFWKQVDRTDKKHQGNMLSAFRDILGYRGELDKLKNDWGNLRGYAPRNRKDGDYHVSVFTTGKDGERVKVYMKPTLTETGAKSLVREIHGNLEKHLKGNFDFGATYEVEYERNNATPSELLAWKGSEVAVEALLNQAFDRAGVGGKMSVEQWQSLKHEVFQEIAKEIMAQGFGRHGISREESLIEGYDDSDYQSVLKEYISGMAGWLSKMRFAIETTSAAKDISKADPSDKVWVNDYVQDAMKNSTYMDELAATARSVGAVYYLGFKVSSAVINAFQNYTVGQAELSLMMKKAGHKGSAIASLATAQKDVMKDWLDRKRGGKGTLSQEEQDVLFRAVREGTAQAQAVRMISGSQEMGFGTGWKKFTELSMTPFQFVEQMLNREPGILAAYRAFKKTAAGEFDASAYKQAEEFVNNTHYIMGKENLPEIVRKVGPAAKTAYLFQGYVHNYLHWIYNRSKDGEFATIARSLGVIAALGGVFALPGADDLDKWIMKWYGVSYKMKFKKFIRDNAGDSMPGTMLQNFINHGATSVAGVDMSRALSVNIPFVSDPDKSFSDRIGGVWGGITAKPGMALNAVGSGDYYRAIESLMPEFAANPMRALRQFDNGATTMAGKPVFDESGKQMKYGLGDAVLKSMGFNPIAVSERTELKGNERSLQSFWKDKRDDVLAAIRKADTAEEAREAGSSVIAFNVALRKSDAFGLVPIITAETLRKSRQYKPDKKKLSWERNQLAV